MPENVAPPAPAPGIDTMMHQFDEAVLSNRSVDEVQSESPKEAPPATPPASVKPPEATPEPPKESVKPEVPAEATKAVETPPATEDDLLGESSPEWEKAPEKWRKIHRDTKRKYTQKVQELSTKISNLEKKPFESPGDAAKMEQLTKQYEAAVQESKTYQQKLAETDYKYTQQYQNFKDRASQAFTKGAEVASSLTMVDKEGNQRQATGADFDRLRRMSEVDREEAAGEMFGNRARAVLKYCDAIDQIAEESNHAEAQYAKTHEQTKLQRELESKKHKESFDSQYKTALESLKQDKELGRWLAEDPNDPEGAKLVRNGFEEIDRLISEQSTAPMESVAQNSARMRAKAAIVPRILDALKSKDAKLTALEAELAKYRVTDPGAKGATGMAPLQPKKQGGIDSMIAEMADKIDNVR